MTNLDCPPIQVDHCRCPPTCLTFWESQTAVADACLLVPHSPRSAPYAHCFPGDESIRMFRRCLRERVLGSWVFVRNFAGSRCVQQQSAAGNRGVPARSARADECLWHVSSGDADVVDVVHVADNLEDGSGLWLLLYRTSGCSVDPKGVRIPGLLSEIAFRSRFVCVVLCSVYRHQKPSCT